MTVDDRTADAPPRRRPVPDWRRSALMPLAALTTVGLLAGCGGSSDSTATATGSADERGPGGGGGELLDAIRVVARGDALLSPRATRSLIARFLTDPAPQQPARPPSTPAAFAELTDREREMVVFAAHGLGNDEIAGRLFLSPRSVKTHLNRAMSKLCVRDRAQLVVLAYQNGLVQPDDQPPFRAAVRP